MNQLDEPRRPLRADARRSIASIIDASRAVLGEDPRADMRTIAGRAGLNRATVYRHFPSRDELVGAVYLEYVERFTQAVETLDAKAGDPLAELRRGTFEVLSVVDHWRPFRYAAPYPDDVADHRMRMGRVLVPFFEAGQARGVFRADLDALDLATAWGMPFPFASIRMAEGYWSRERAVDFILALLTPSR